MSYEDLSKLLNNIVDTEFTKRSSNLHSDIDKALSRLAAKGLASSSVAVQTIINLCQNDISERIHFIFENAKRIIDAKNIPYDHELNIKTKELTAELSKTAKAQCLNAGIKVIEKINKGSVEGSTQIINQKYQLELQEVLNEMEIYFDELKNKTTFTFKGWFKEHTTALILTILGAIIGAIASLILT